MDKPARPSFPGMDAPLAERQKWAKRHARFLRPYCAWLTAQYGAAHATTVIRQEIEFAQLMTMSEPELIAAYRSSAERLRNLLGRDFKFVWPDKKDPN